MSESTEMPVADPVRQPRSLGSVLGILGAIVVLPLLIVLLVVIVRGTGGGGQADALMDGVRDNRIQAVYLNNQRVYFGNLDAVGGDWLKLSDAYFLRQNSDTTEKAQEEASTDLVPVQQEVGGDGDLVISASEVTLVQNLAADSSIAGQIEDATR